MAVACDGTRDIADDSGSSSDDTAALDALDCGLPTNDIAKLLSRHGDLTYTDEEKETTPLANEPCAPNRGTMGIGKAGKGVNRLVDENPFFF